MNNCCTPNNAPARRNAVEFAPIDRFIARVFDDPFFTPRAIANGKTTIDDGRLALDIAETDDHLTVLASLPGFTKDQIDIEVDDGVLTIKAEREETTEQTTAQFHRKERRLGSIHRRLTLPTPVSEDGASAELKDGVLTLTLPKAARPTGRKVAING